MANRSRLATSTGITSTDRFSALSQELNGLHRSRRDEKQSNRTVSVAFLCGLCKQVVTKNRTRDLLDSLGN